jgi:hypothetical protein
MKQIPSGKPGGSPPRGQIETAAYRPPYLAAAVASLAGFALYAITLSRTTWFWDTSEYIATAHIMGIPHPPGNPLFVVLARAWELLLAPTGLSVAVRINLFSAVMSALAHGLWFLVAHRILSYFSSDRLFRLAGAGGATLIGATAFTVWNQSNVNEKVYTVSLFTIALLSWLAFLWRDNLGEGKDDNLILLMVFILALSVGAHLMAYLAAPALLIFIVLVEPRTLMNWRLYAGAAVVGLLGLSIHLFLPLRAQLGPIINEADPSTWTALLESLARKQYDKPSMMMNPIDRQSPRDIGLFLAQIGNYLYYFDWQWARAVAGAKTVFGGARPLFTLVFALLGLYGAWTHYKKDRTSWAYVATLFVTLSLGLVFYLNFKYGYSWPTRGQVPMEWREVRERDYFFIVSFSLWGVWAGVGLAALWQYLGERIAAGGGSHRRGFALTSPVLAVALIPLAFNWGWADRSHAYSARDWAYNLLQSVEPYGVLFTNGDNDTFPLWYLQEVEGIRRDVTVMVMSYLNTPWYVKQIQQITTPCPEGVHPNDDETRILCQRPFLPEQAPDFYATGAAARPDHAGTPLELAGPTMGQPPTHSIIPGPPSDIDDLLATFSANMSAFVVREPMGLAAGNLEFTVPPNQLLSPADIFMLQIVQSSITDRPIYFASTTQAYENVGLAPFLIRQGLALKLNNGPVQENPAAGIYKVPDEMAIYFGNHIDLPRTDSLLWNVFMHRGGLPDQWGQWVDVATKGFPTYYGYTHMIAAQIHAAQGNDAEADRHLERVEAWIDLSRR